MFNDIYKERNVLVTGHTGFKGSWLAYWLTRLGANVMGAALPPSTEPNHYDLLTLRDRMASYVGVDLRTNFSIPQDTEIVFHLAAMAIPVLSFQDPAEVFNANVMGTVHVLDACRKCPTIKAVVMITTDKVYEAKEWGWGYREIDELGGLDPYSASKVCAEYVIRCYREQFIPMVATARAGNVIGGGDWTYMRLIPDIARAAFKGEPVPIYTPNATRPWQHVLEPLSGYLLLGQKLLEGHKWAADAWNFGPEGEMTVLEIVQAAQGAWSDVKYIIDEKETHPSMTRLLKLDSSKSKKELGWYPAWDMKFAVEQAIDWYRCFYTKGEIKTLENIRHYEAKMSSMEWHKSGGKNEEV